ncbi:hypothetical protein ACPPVV_15215 [Rhodanobacter sp. Col0626]|uniref:hypothetical protein n=1 Tax=Rhodanobacter sp. Col0626 TaxID=3415679 RepID=UPI003CF7810C
MFSSWVHRLQALRLHATAPSISRRGMRVTASELATGLPSLGNVLYLPMQSQGAKDWKMSRGLLVEAWQLAPLLQTRRLVAGCMITVEGPREWIECVDGQDRACARLYLLPDTDYLAWDSLLLRGELTASPVRQWRHAHPANAQVLRFHARRLAGLDVLGAEASEEVSSLSRQLAGRIARAEAVSLQLAGGG